MKVVKKIKNEPLIDVESVIYNLKKYGGENGIFVVAFSPNGHNYFSMLAPRGESDTPTFGMYSIGDRIDVGSCPWSGCRNTLEQCVRDCMTDGHTCHYFSTAQEFAQAIIDNKWEFHS
jgi:hypothetical protein